MVGKKRNGKSKRSAKEAPLPLTKEGKIDWSKVPRKRLDQMFSPLVPLEDFLNKLNRIESRINVGSSLPEDLEALRAELIEDLSPIADLSEGGYKRFKRSEKVAAAKRMETHLEYLCEKITSLEGLRPVFEVWTRKLKTNRRLQSRAQGIFSWSVGDWVIRLNFSMDSPSRPTLPDPRRDLYAIVAAGLLSGELARLRRCGYCKDFFIAPQPRMTFCRGHARLYYDRPSQRPEAQAEERKSRAKVR